MGKPTLEQPHTTTIAGEMDSRPYLTGVVELPRMMVAPVRDFMDASGKIVSTNTNCVSRKVIGEALFGERFGDFQNGQTIELQWGHYAKWIGRSGRNPNVFDYLHFTAISKLTSRSFGPNARDGNFVAVQDTVNVVRIDGRWIPMEKPATVEQAVIDANILVSGAPIMLTTASAFAEVPDIEVDGMVDRVSKLGAAMTVYPLQFEIPGIELRKRVAKTMVQAMDAGHLRKTPGVVSSASPALIAFLKVGLWDDPKKHLLEQNIGDGNQFLYVEPGELDKPDRWIHLIDMIESDIPHDRILAPVIEAAITGGDAASLQESVLQVRDWEDLPEELRAAQLALFAVTKEMVDDEWGRL